MQGLRANYALQRTAGRLVSRTVRHLLVIVAGVAIIAALLFSGCSEFRKAKLVAEDSAQRSLLTETERLLDAHHAARKSYPQSLTELQFTNWPDGSSSKTLLTFQYNSRGTSYVLTCTSVWTGRVFVVQR